MSDLQSAVSLSNVSLTRSGSRHLNEITVDFPAASHTVIIGENGSGKSTLLDVISRDTKAGEGTVSIFRRDILSYTLPELAQHRAYLKQHQSLGFELSVFDVVKLGAINSRIDRDNLVGEVLVSLDLENLREKLYPNLSGGEKQRVQIARVLAQCWQAENHVCLLDEPMSSLDIKHQQQLIGLLQDLTDRGLTLISVMHDLEVARHAADFLLLMKAGEICDFGPADKVFTDQNIQKTFGVKWPLKISD